MSVVKDMALAPAGEKKIDWVRAYMPVLSHIERQWRATKPLSGLRIAVSIHLEAKTANLALVLAAAGAETFVTGSNPLSTKDDVAAALAAHGVETFGVYGVDQAGYEDLLLQTLQCHPHLIIDDGGDLVQLLSGRAAAYADALIGGCEETTTGILRLRQRQREGTLPCPMMLVNDAKAKHYYDNKYGTGQSVWTSIMDTTNLIVAGKTVVVAGFGWCGKGVALRAAGMGADVIVTEVDPFAALDATMQGFHVMPMDEAAALGDIFVTVTGCKDVIVGRHFARMKDGALLCNAGHFDCEINVAELRQLACRTEERRANIEGFVLADGRILNLLGAGRLVNLVCGLGHPAEIMDMSFAVQALSVLWLAERRGRLERTLYEVPEELDRQIGAMKLQTMGLAIDELTPAQRQYLFGEQ